MRRLAVASTCAFIGLAWLTPANAEFYAGGPIQQASQCQKTSTPSLEYYGWMEACPQPTIAAGKKKKKNM